MNRKRTFAVLAALIMVAIGVVTFNACKKNNDINTSAEMMSQSLTNENNYSYNWPTNGNEVDELLLKLYDMSYDKEGIFQRIWKWIKAHTGTHLFANCPGNNPCGPCPGICLLSKDSADVFVPVEEDYSLSRSEYEEGDRLLQIALLNDSVMAISFINNNFTIDGVFYVPEDFMIGESASNLFGKNTIKVLEGEYPVSYTHSRNGTTLVHVDVR